MATWQPTLSWHDAKARAGIINKIRQFFLEREVVEVDTPQLSAYGVTDVFLDTFQTNFLHSAQLSAQDEVAQCLHLQTSPEFAMKRLLASGYQSVYQLCKAYRNEPYGRFHNPEFTMLEWYRIGYDHFALMEEVEQLLLLILNCDGAERISYQRLFIQYVEIDPLDCSLEDLKHVLVKYDKWSSWMKAEVEKDTFLQLIFTEIIEPQIGLSSPCFVYDFPSSQASLAKLSSEDPRVAQRFECYFKGVELVNGFNELTSANEQRVRFEQDNLKRAELGKDIINIDDNFINALSAGLPDCAGVALGVDRLVMLALNKKHIRDVLTFDINQA